ncbi:hypothetical protein BFJ71_g15396 [Fusarium oxysporum]|nr:hypothetical protein BFJ71_g15396 [Fusarium oxysporum]
MIFTHRSAELVCAYMGTLAAGAIVTVLDPQYTLDSLSSAPKYNLPLQLQPQQKTTLNTNHRP